MRISFPNQEHEDTLVGAGDTLIGAAADNTIVLDRSGVAPHHLRLSLNDRGIVLGVLDAQARTHVNTRPVREKAIVRLGDVISLDTLQFVLKPDRDDSIRTDIPSASSIAPVAAAAADSNLRIVPPRVLLRGLSGNHFGKIVPVRGSLVIGRGAEADLILDEPETALRHAAIEIDGDTIVLRNLDSTGGTFVNGVEVRDAILFAGDQIAFGRNRFVLEAPGLPLRSMAPTTLPRAVSPNITQTMKAIQLPDERVAEDKAPREDKSSKNDIWWLIIAAALIAAGLALLFLVKV
jgi:pSer/pThr/pTyr-binding forkhead associated (FHA) protein